MVLICLSPSSVFFLFFFFFFFRLEEVHEKNESVEKCGKPLFEFRFGVEWIEFSYDFFLGGCGNMKHKKDYMWLDSGCWLVSEEEF